MVVVAVVVVVVVARWPPDVDPAPVLPAIDARLVDRLTIVQFMVDGWQQQQQLNKLNNWISNKHMFITEHNIHV